VGGVLLMAVTVVGGYKNLVPKLFFRRGVIQNLIILKSFRFLIFKIPGSHQKLSQNEIWREDFFKSVCSRQKFLKSCSRQK
jgi:hypothetical protein